MVLAVREQHRHVCDYSSYGSCQSANRGKEQGTCVQKQ
jgi:hypothetical protein